MTMTCPYCERPMDRTGKRWNAQTCGHAECQEAHKRKKKAQHQRGYYHRHQKREARGGW